MSDESQASVTQPPASAPASDAAAGAAAAAGAEATAAAPESKAWNSADFAAQVEQLNADHQKLLGDFQALQTQHAELLAEYHAQAGDIATFAEQKAAWVADQEKLLALNAEAMANFEKAAADRDAATASLKDAQDKLAAHLSGSVRPADDTWAQLAAAHLVSRANNGDTFAGAFLAAHPMAVRNKG